MGGGGKNSSPPSADFQGAQQNDLNANRPTQVTPWGTTSWDRGPTMSYEEWAAANPVAAGGRSDGPPPGSGPPPGVSGGGGGTTATIDTTSGAFGAISEKQRRDEYQKYLDSRPWTQNTTLDPKLQAALDAQLQLQQQRSNFAESLFPGVQNAFSQPLDYSGLEGLDYGDSARQAGYNAAYEQEASRLDPQWQKRRSMFETQLLNQGLQRGTEAWDTAMNELGRQENDAYSGARRQATLLGEQMAQGQFGRSLAGRQQGIGETLQKRSQPLNELMAVLNGQQVGMPQMPGFTPSNYMGAAQNQYNANMNSYSAQQAQNQGYMNMFGNLAMLPFLL